MLEFHTDVGQLFIVVSIGIVGWFIRKEIMNIGKRLDIHEDRLFDLHGVMQNAIGQLGILFKLMDVERRIRERE